MIELDYIELHDNEAPRDLDREEELIRMARIKAQIEQMKKNEARVIRLRRDFPKGIPVYREESKEFPAIDSSDMG